MTVRNVNIGRKTPTPDQIQRFKDFDQLKSRVDLHEKSREVSGTGASGGGMSRSLWYITGAAAVLLAGFSIFAVFTEETVSNNGVAPQHTSLILGDKPEANETVIEQVEQDRAEFKAPFKHQNIDVDFTEYIVEASEGASLEYTSGTRIIIPAHAFLNNIGRPLKGKVKVRYRELNGAMDIFLAGVPMHYDSAGVRNELESAGMIELRAYQNNGEEVYPNPDNKIRIQLASNETTNSFNLYNFDEKSRNWVYQGKDEVAIFEADENGRSTGKKKSASKKTGKSKQIVPEDEEVKRFGLRNLKNYHPTLRITDKNAYKRQGSLNFMFSDIVTLQPEMAVFDKMVWHYERGIQTDDTRFFEELLSNSFKGGNYIYRYWDHVKVTYSPPKDYLALVFIQRENNKKVTVNLLPSFGGRFKGLTCSDLYIDYLNLQDSIADAQLAILRGDHQKVNNSVFVQRSFDISEFGLWSCEKVFRYKTPQVVSVNFLNEEKEYINYRELYCVYKEPKSVVRFGKARRISLDRSADMAILAIIDDKTVGYITPEQIRSLSPSARDVELTLSTSNDIRGTLVRIKGYLTGGALEDLAQ